MVHLPADDPEPDDIADDLLALIKPELAPGERLVWSARGRTMVGLAGQLGPQAGPIVWVVGLILACVIGLSLASSPPRLLDPFASFLVLVSLISGIVGFYMIVGTVASVVSKGWRNQGLNGQVYALTDRRAIIWYPEAKSSAVSVRSFERGSIKLENMKRTQYPDGSGDLAFLEAYQEPSGFLGVPEVNRVEALVRRYLIASDPT